MAKDKQQKHSVAERKAASAKMKRKEFEKEPRRPGAAVWKVEWQRLMPVSILRRRQNF